MSAGTPPQARLPGWAKAALIASLALNLAVAGLVVGVILRGPVFDDLSANLPVDGFRTIAGAMNDSDRAALRQDLRERRADIRAGRKALRAHRREFFAALRAEPFSDQALTRVLDDYARTWDQVGLWARNLLVDRIAAMSPEARIAFADRLEDRLRHPRRRDRGEDADTDG